MHVIVGDRRAGKTTRAVEWLRERPDERAIVVSNSTMQKHLLREFGIQKDQVLVAQPGFRYRGARELLVEDAEEFFGGLGRVRVITISATADVLPPPEWLDPEMQKKCREGAVLA